MTVTSYHSQSDLPIDFSQVQLLVKTVLAFKQVKCDEVICHFVDCAAICALHRDFFNDETPTDCISFPLDSPATSPHDDYLILGEIFVCPKVALDYALSKQLSPYKEVSLYIVHGLLHLIGYTDIKVSEKRIMRREEKLCLCYLEENQALLTP